MHRLRSVWKGGVKRPRRWDTPPLKSHLRRCSWWTTPLCQTYGEATDHACHRLEFVHDFQAAPENLLMKSRLRNLKSLLEHQRYQEAIQRFDSLPDDRSLVSVDILDQLILAAARLGSPEKVVAIYHEIVTRNQKLTAGALDAVMAALNSVGGWDLAKAEHMLFQLHERSTRKRLALKILSSLVRGGKGSCDDILNFFIKIRSQGLATNKMYELLMEEASRVEKQHGNPRTLQGGWLKLKERLCGAEAFRTGYQATGSPVEVLFALMQEDKIPLKSTDYNYLFASLKRQRRPRDAVARLKSMSSNGVKPSRGCLTSVLAACIKSDALPEAELVWHEYKRLGYEPDVFTYGCLFNLYSRKKEFEKVMSVFEDMKTAGISPNAIIYTTVIDVCYRAQRLDLAEKMFKEMVDNQVRPTAVTFNSMLRMYATACDREKMENYLQLMKQMGVPFTTCTFNTYLSLLRREKDIDAARKVCMEILGNLGESQVEKNPCFKVNEWHGVKPDSATVVILIQILGDAGDVEMAERVLRELEGRVSLSVAAYNSLLTIYDRHGLKERLRKLFTEMEERGPGPNSISYGILLGTVLREDTAYEARRMRAEQALVQMESRGILVDLPLWNMLLRFHITNDDLERAELCVQKIGASGQQPSDVTQLSMVDLYTRMGQDEKAEALYESILTKEEEKERGSRAIENLSLASISGPRHVHR